MIISSNPCPFLLWIATFNLSCNIKADVRSNPCPFLLWIATFNKYKGNTSLYHCSNPCPFLLWIATCFICQACLAKTLVCSNPCPFLLWIATLSIVKKVKMKII